METVDQTRLRIETLIKEKAPTIDLSPGSVFSELLTKLTATAQTALYNKISDIEAAKTVQDVLSSSTDTYSDTIDRLASNYETYRNAGSKASGNIKVIVSQAKTYYIPSGFQFTQPNLNFTYQTTSSYTINTTSTIKLLQDGTTYYFVLPVEATAVGIEKQVSYGTKFAPVSTSAIPQFVDAYATGAFTSGANKETDKELITRFRLGLSVKNLISPAAISAYLKDNYTSSYRAVSVIGSGDPEAIRGGSNPLGITVPGMVDVYVRMCDALPTQVVTITGAKITSGVNTGKWQITIPATAVPGLYRVVSIIKQAGGETGTQAFTSVTYGFDTTGYTAANAISSAVEARFTRYQTCTVIFDYPSTNTTENFDVTCLYQPQVGTLQTDFLENTQRIPCADYLIKGITPCNVSVKVHLVKNNTLDVIDTVSIKTAIFTYINSLAIGASIDASKIVDICHDYNIKRVDLPITLTGAILAPKSTTDMKVYISGTDTLTIPTNTTLGISPNTTAFFTNYYDENGNETISVEVS